MSRSNMYFVLDEAGDPVPEDDVLAWSRWVESSNRTVALTDLGWCRVSTVFLGINHQFAAGPPILWETMVFGLDDSDQYQRRYASKDEAIIGHGMVVDLLRGKKDQPCSAALGDDWRVQPLRQRALGDDWNAPVENVYDPATDELPAGDIHLRVKAPKP